MGRAPQLCPARGIQWCHKQWGKTNYTNIYFIAYSIVNIRSRNNSSHSRPYNEKIFCFCPIKAYNPSFSALLVWNIQKGESSCIFCGNLKLTDFFSTCSQYFAFRQLGDLQLCDLMEPVMPGDWDRYFPDGVQNQYCMSLSQDQTTDWGIRNLTTLLRK